MDKVRNKMDDIIKCIKDIYWNSIKKKPNVVGFSGKLKHRIKDGKELKDTKVFRVYVTEKDDSISCKDMVPSTLEVKNACDCSINTIGVDIVAIGKIKYMDANVKSKKTKTKKKQIETMTIPSDHQKRCRPYMAGVSADHILSTACTMNSPYKKKVGMTVTNEPIYKTYISSNGHCFGLENDAKQGDCIVQPSAYDGGNLITDKIAEFAFGVETKFTNFTCPFRNLFFKLYKALFKVATIKQFENINKVDISFAEPINLDEVGYGIYGETGKITGKGKHTEGSTIWKSGRTSAITSGIIIDNSWTGNVQGRRGVAVYEDCVLTNCHCEGGDSGSSVYMKDANGNLTYMGALFAGSDTTMIYCKWENIESEAGVELSLN